LYNEQVDEFIRKGRFQGPVLGPIGAYVKIVAGKEQFASIAEQAIGIGALDRFIVTNDHDRKVLQSIRKKVGCQQDCGIFQIHQHPKYDVPQPPVEGIETVASVLNISNDLVFNCLVDNCKIDERALSQSREESERLLLVKGNNGRYSIRGKVKNVFILPQGDNWSVRDGNISMVANEKKLRQTIGVDKSAALADAKREAQSIKEELDVLRREESRLEHEHHEHQKDWNVKKRENQKIAKDIDKCVVVCDNIRNEQVAAASFDTDTSSEESDVAEAQAAADALKEEEQTLKEQIEENKPEIQDLKAKLEEVRTRNYKVLEDIKVAEDDLAQYVQSISQREEKLEKKREKVRQYETIIEQQEQKVKRLKASAKEDLKNARKIAYQRVMEERREALETGGKEVDDSQFTQDPTDEDLEEIEITETDKEPSYYEARMARATRKIEQEKERRNATRDDPAIAFQKYDRAKKKLQGKVEQIKQIDETSENLKKDMQQRKKRWRQFRTHIATTTDQRFDEILNLKGSSGEIEFDHVGNQLHLVVQKDAKDANSQQKDVKALSGGERSYTTIALLLALGESLETPFRVLDEFDVFLDPVTRKLTIDALIRMAKAMQHRQFIFITPQDVSQVEVDPMLYVLKMRPPSRNDVAGGPTQRTLDFSQTQS
jgi:chromosome segregation ATPase